jgi:hypothetical protein
MSGTDREEETELWRDVGNRQRGRQENMESYQKSQRGTQEEYGELAIKKISP